MRVWTLGKRWCDLLANKKNQWIVGCDSRQAVAMNCGTMIGLDANG